MELFDTEFDPVVVGVSTALGAVAIAVTYLLRNVLLQAPGTAGPLLLTVWLGPLFLVAWLKRRRSQRSPSQPDEDPWER